MKTGQYILIAFFTLFIGSVGSNILLFGKEKSGYEKKTSLPAPQDLFTHDNKGRKTFEDYIQTDYWLRRQAVKWRNKADLYIGGSLATKQVLSGQDGFLFFRPQFLSSGCTQTTKKIKNSLQTMDNLKTIAALVDITLDLSFSPDKSVVYSDKLSPKSNYIWRCRLEKGRALRNEITNGKYDIFDYTNLILPLKKKNEHSIFYKTDTHWSSEVTPTISRKLASEIYDLKEEKIPAISFTDDFTSKKTDLNKMLKFAHKTEKTRALNSKAFEDFIAATPVNEKVMIIHDSFFDSGRNIARDFLNEKENVQAIRPRQIKEIDKFKPTHIYYNSVEREFLKRTPLFTPSSKLYQYIVKKQQEYTKRCIKDSSSRYTPKLTFLNIKEKIGNLAYVSTNNDPKIATQLKKIPQKSCVSIEIVSTEESEAQIYYKRDPKSRKILPPYHMTVPLKKGLNKIYMTLPPQTGLIRIDPLRSATSFDFNIAVYPQKKGL